MGFKVAHFNAGQQRSEKIELQAKNDQRLQDAPCGVVFPTAMIGSGFTFETSFDGGNTWKVVDRIDGGSVYSAAKTNDHFVPIDPRAFIALRVIRLVSTAIETTAIDPLLIFGVIA